jgi:hypothetical protein
LSSPADDIGFYRPRRQRARLVLVAVMGRDSDKSEGES